MHTVYEERPTQPGCFDPIGEFNINKVGGFTDWTDALLKADGQGKIKYSTYHQTHTLAPGRYLVRSTVGDVVQAVEIYEQEIKTTARRVRPA